MAIEDLHDAEVVDEEDADETALAIVKDPGRYAWLPGKDWYAFHEDALREIAVDWCDANGIAYTDKRGQLTE